MWGAPRAHRLERRPGARVAGAAAAAGWVGSGVRRPPRERPSSASRPPCRPPALPAPPCRRAFLAVGSLMFCAHCARLALRAAPPLAPAQNAQNAAFLAGMLLLLLLLR